MMKPWTLLLSAILLLNVSACSMLSGNKKEKEAPKATTLSAEELLRRGRAAASQGDWEQAIKGFETLEANYPLGKYAEQSLLEQAHAYYRFDEADSALDTIDRFSRMFPGSKSMDYALYLRGLVNFNRGGSLLDRIFPRSFSDLDAVRQKEAFHDFQKLVTRYPASSYAPDAAKRLGFLRNTLGEAEVNVARYYMQRKAYVAAFNRAEYTIKHHQTSPAVIDALKIKYCAAKQLNKPQIAQDALRVLAFNFPKAGKKVSCKF